MRTPIEVELLEDILTNVMARGRPALACNVPTSKPDDATPPRRQVAPAADIR